MRRLLPLLCGLLLAACGQRAARPIGDFTLPVYTPRYASGFEITGAAGSRSTLVTVHNPWYGDEVTDQYLFIARDGEPAPAGFEGQVLRDEARRVVCMSGSYIAMLDALGAADRVVGVSGAQYLINETLRRRIARGEAADVGFDSNVDFERLMALRPDLVMLFGIGGADTALTGKLRELGIPYLYMGEHCEESPLGKSEWVVVAAEIAGLRTEGSRLFAAIPERYERLRALAQQTADDHAGHHGHNTNKQRYTRAEHHTDENITAVKIRSKPVLPRRRTVAKLDVLGCYRRFIEQHIGKNGQQDNDSQQHQTNHCALVSYQTEPNICSAAVATRARHGNVVQLFLFFCSKGFHVGLLPPPLLGILCLDARVNKCIDQIDDQHDERKEHRQQKNTGQYAGRVLRLDGQHDQ